MYKKLVITGASGFVGRQLVPRLMASGCKLLLVGRNPRELEAIFPGIRNCTYEQIAEEGRDFDIVLHLAVLNNDASSSASEFQRVNVEFILEILTEVKKAGISKFVNITTFHALDGIGSEYARSKRAALDVLDNEVDLTVTNIFLPAVYGDEFSGKLKFVKKLPESTRAVALRLLSALVPTIHINKLSDYILNRLDRAPRSVMLANSQDQNSVYVIGKRLIDLVFSFAVIVFAGWLLMIVWALVRLGSRGPGIFAQQRLGKNGRPFTCYKFRTMKTGTRQAGTHEMTADAITWIGAFLRKSKIDELPQVWNILRGELSLVGPRPGLPVQTGLTAARTAHGVFCVLPGITGLAQINGIDMSDPERLAQMDARYIAQRGLLLDLKIVVATFLGKGQGDKIGS